MNRLVKLAATTALVASTASLAFAQGGNIEPQGVEAKPYGEAGAWGIYTNPLLADGCFAVANYDGGTEVRMGIDNRTGRSYVAAFNDAWVDMIDDLEVPITYDIDGEVFATEGAELEEYGREGVAAYFGADLLAALNGRGVMTIVVEGEPRTAVVLEQTTGALDMVMECQAAT